MAVAALASCVKSNFELEETKSEIKLAPVAAKQTKANVFSAIDGTTYPTAENFDVYGYWKNVGAGEEYTDGDSYFGETAVEFVNKGNYWGGAKSYYWPKNGALRFAAYSPSSLDVAHSQVGVEAIRPHADGERDVRGRGGAWHEPVGTGVHGNPKTSFGYFEDPYPRPTPSRAV